MGLQHLLAEQCPFRAALPRTAREALPCADSSVLEAEAPLCVLALSQDGAGRKL